MSNAALLSSLPRFDAEDETHPADKLKRLLGQMQAAAARPAQPAAAEEAAEDTAAPVEDTGPSLAELDRVVADLSGVMARLEQESREHSMQVIQSLAARLFPELSRHFLAEEIGEHLPKLVPPSVPAVEIRAAPAMLEKLEPIVARNTALAGRCSLVPAENNSVEVSWKTGGVTFDFEALLDACLAHLDPAQTLIEE